MSDTNANITRNINAGNVGGNRNVRPGGNSAISNLFGTAYSPALSKAMPLVIGALFIAIMVAFFSFSQRSNVRTIYDGLPEAERSKVLDALISSGYSASVHPATGKIQIPNSDYHAAKLALAGQGLPNSAVDGYDKLSDLPMGASKSIEAMKLKQTQEIEIARSIISLNAVREARVHLALPEKSVFARQRVDPTASVFVTLRPGQSLTNTQVIAIVNLVEKSVSGLSSNNVSVIDENGRLLTSASGDPEALIDNSEFQFKVRLENIYKRKIEEILTPLVGVGNASAQVNVLLDTTRVEFTEELFDPKKNVIVEEQKSIQKQPQQSVVGGVPGATSNRPPVNIETSNQPKAVNEETTNGEENIGRISSKQQLATESITESRSYEVSKVIKTTREANNKIIKLDTAVLLRKPRIIDSTSGELVPKEYSATKLAEIEKLIMSTIGFELNRGDTLALSVSDFEPITTELTTQWYETDWFKTISQNFGMVLMLGIVVLGIIRPLMNRLLIPVSNANVGDIAKLNDESGIQDHNLANNDSIDEIINKLRPRNSGISLEMLETANTYDDKVAIVKMLVADESKRASNVLRQMMQQDTKK